MTSIPSPLQATLEATVQLPTVEQHVIFLEYPPAELTEKEQDVKTMIEEANEHPDEIKLAQVAHYIVKKEIHSPTTQQVHEVTFTVSEIIARCAHFWDVEPGDLYKIMIHGLGAKKPETK